jgi:hypothetical protein
MRLFGWIRSQLEYAGTIPPNISEPSWNGLFRRWRSLNVRMDRGLKSVTCGVERPKIEVVR